VVYNPADIAIGERESYDGAEPIYGPIPHAAGRQLIPCLTDKKGTSVIITLGQSNAANFAGGHYAARGEVANFNLYDGRCYRAIDPLLGASGDGGNFATRLGDILIQRSFAKRIVLAPIGMGNTRIEHWSFGGVFNKRILVLIRQLCEAGVIPNLILWQQGEGNAGDVDIGGHNYRRHLLEVVQTFRNYGVTAPFMIALCTLCGDPHPNAEDTRAGQRTAVCRQLGTLLGPDTDCIGHEDRFDRCHMSESGVQKQAEMWADSIVAQLRPTQE
jgi:carbohydrate esterase-like sialic acid-specific acetylesterase